MNRSCRSMPEGPAVLLRTLGCLLVLMATVQARAQGDRLNAHQFLRAQQATLEDLSGFLALEGWGAVRLDAGDHFRWNGREAGVTSRCWSHGAGSRLCRLRTAAGGSALLYLPRPGVGSSLVDELAAAHRSRTEDAPGGQQVTTFLLTDGRRSLAWTNGPLGDVLLAYDDLFSRAVGGGGAAAPELASCPARPVERSSRRSPEGTSAGVDAPPQVEEEVWMFAAVEEKPTFPGGEGEFYKYLGKNVKYPTMEAEQGIEGRVFVEFVVDKDGGITEVRAVRGVSPGLDKEAIRVMKASPKWAPGKQNGRAVKVRYVIPINFDLR